MPGRFHSLIVLLLIVAAISSATAEERAIVATNTGPTAAKLNVDPAGDPVVFELGMSNRHWRRIYPCLDGKKPVVWARPGTSYEIWKTDPFVDYVLKSVCRADPRRMSETRKLSRLATALFDLRASRITDESANKIRLASEAYQALVGIEFDCSMDYAASEPADYRIFAGRSFRVQCRIANEGFENVGPCTVRIIAPDEWTVTGDAATFTVSPSQTKRCISNVKAPGASMLRPKQYPVIAELSFRHQGRKITVHYPVTVEMSNPFTATLKILSADPEHINAEISTRSLFPGTAMNSISAYQFIPDSIKVDPAKQSFSFKESGRFHLTYTKGGEPSPVLRAVMMRMREDEHTVNLRTVMEAYLPLGRRTYGEALWMNDCEDGKTVEAAIGDRRCRQTVSGSRMYFAVSPNLPTSGKTYITLTYFDGPHGSFRVQYDSFAGAYKDSRETVRLAGTDAWRQATFVLTGINFANRQAAASDFRVAASGVDLAITDVIVSKFPPGDTRNR